MESGWDGTRLMDPWFTQQHREGGWYAQYLKLNLEHSPFYHQGNEHFSLASTH